jgi:hypothetical protein
MRDQTLARLTVPRATTATVCLKHGRLFGKMQRNTSSLFRAFLITTLQHLV